MINHLIKLKKSTTVLLNLMWFTHKYSQSAYIDIHILQNIHKIAVYSYIVFTSLHLHLLNPVFSLRLLVIQDASQMVEGGICDPERCVWGDRKSGSDNRRFVIQYQSHCHPQQHSGSLAVFTGDLSHKELVAG